MGAYFTYYLTGFIMIPVVLFAAICQWKVNIAFNKYSRVRGSRGMTGADAAYQLLKINGINDVKIKRVSGNLTDHYNPKTKEICLSEGVFSPTSVAAIGIACHEAGHACQHAEGYFPLKIRNAVIPATRIGSWLGVPLAVFGMLLYSDTLIYIGLVLYAAVALFQFITLPVEFNASHRALNIIEANGFLDSNEYNGAKSVLSAAALTYVAALTSALAVLYRLIVVISRNRR